MKRNPDKEVFCLASAVGEEDAVDDDGDVVVGCWLLLLLLLLLLLVLDVGDGVGVVGYC